MSARPPIPARVYRRILVEAGHRCAIHSCRYPDVDVHHIIPWEQCREHSYENLIALCPNCHRRAGAGEIDRKSLRMYKAKLAAGITANEAPAITSTSVDPGPEQAWRTMRITDVKGGRGNFELEIPQFLLPDLAELNQVEHGWAVHEVLKFRNHIAIADLLIPDGHPEAEVWGSFEVIQLTADVVSVRYAINSYFRGAAHPNLFFRTANVRRDPLFLLTFSDLFLENTSYLDRVSRIAIEQLLRTDMNRNEASDEWIRMEAGPAVDHFSHFNISEAGIVIAFPPYAVASYGDGPQYVTIPWSAVRDTSSPLLKH